MSEKLSLTVGETATSDDPVIEVEAGLPAGRYLVQLVVETEAGTQSQPVRWKLVVEEPG
jgi:hypothetical protein